MPTPERMNKILEVVKSRQQGIIVLEDIHDPHNAEAVLRTCDVFGFQTIYFIFVEEKRFNPVRVGKLSSSSANKWLDYKIFHSREECISDLKSQGYTVYATAIGDNTKSLYDKDLTQNPKLAICFGNEQRGISKELSELVDELIMIPMCGMVQSLNLSVTAAIVMYEISRQRRSQEGFSLSSDEQEKLISDFILR